MARYRVLVRSFVGNNLVEPGAGDASIIEFDDVAGRPSKDWELLDAPRLAKTGKKPKPETDLDDSLA